jgi:hypothetical protein
MVREVHKLEVELPPQHKAKEMAVTEWISEFWTDHWDELVKSTNGYVRIQRTSDTAGKC